jgi:hypothetical protein
MMTSARGENKSELTRGAGRAFQAVNLVIFAIMVSVISLPVQEMRAAGARVIRRGDYQRSVSVQGT